MSVESELRKASTLEKRGQEAEAIKLYSSLLERFPNNKRAADAVMRVRTKSILSATKTGTLTPEHLKPLIGLCETGHLQEAEFAFGRLIKAFPKHAPLLNIGGVIYSRLQAFGNAVDCFRRSLTLQPDVASTHSNLGNALLESGDVESAEEAFERALEIAPRDVFALSNLGRLLAAEGRFDDAEEKFRLSLSIAPENIEIILNFGNLLIDIERLQDAVSMLSDVLKRHPEEWRVHKSLAVALVRSQENDAALAHYRTALELNPGVPEIEHMIDALSGEQRPRASATYVETLFDGFAKNFDENLTGKLGYRLPEETAQLLRETLASGRVRNLLDLGCGTGLLAAHVRDFTDVLVGVDLSAKMLGRAAHTGNYDELVKADVHDFLTSGNTCFDVMVALDVLIYVGETDSLLKAAAARCDPAALIILSTETFEGEGFTLLPSGRYAHADSYVDTCAMRHGFEIKQRQQTIIRTEQGQPVAGSLHVLVKSR